ncbi:MAG: ADP-ribosylglycohydrolase family protein [Verrucomicrobiae bacterium]|nr:ADP-ribosylglycohydrolase family protein [Verrucomicrobiae bacterium]
MRRTCVGSLLGLAVGDAMGASVEFKAPGSFSPVTKMRGGGPFGLKPGQWTDDTSMALCLAESLIAKKGFDARDQMERYLRWYRQGYHSSTGKCFDIGNTTRTALETFERTGNPFSGPTDPDTAGNGSLMRLAPVPLFFWRDPVRAIKLAAESSRTTHGARAAVDACRYLAALLVGCCREATKRELLSPRYSPIPGYWETHPLCPEVDAVAGGFWRGKSAGDLPASGYVLDTLEATLWAFATTDNFKDGCLKAVNLGNDADTTGAVYGQLAGAFYGCQEIPGSWIKTLAFEEAIKKLADDPLFDRPKAEYGDACG